MPITRSGTKHAVVTPDDNDAFDENTPPNHQGKRVKRSSGVGNAPDVVIASKKGAQDAIDSIVAQLQGGVPWKNIVQYGESQGHKLGKPIRCDAHSLKEILAFVALSFEPDRKDDKDPSVLELKIAMWKMLVHHYRIKSDEATGIIANRIAWLEVVPYVLPYDADRGTKVTEFNTILEATNDSMRDIQQCVIQSLPNLKACMCLGKRSTNFFINGEIVPEHLLSGNQGGRYRRHPEVFVAKNACADERRAVLKEMSWLLSEILEVEAVDIAKEHEDWYLFGSSLTRSEAHSKSLASKVAKSGAKARKETIQSLIEDAAKNPLIELVLEKDPTHDRDNLTQLSVQDLGGILLDLNPSLLRNRLFYDHWTIEEKAQFGQGVTKYGWGLWSSIATEFLPHRTTHQVNIHGKGCSLEEKDRRDDPTNIVPV